MHDTEIAYQIGDQYFTIQTVEDGYDYTFYDKDYLELDGGVYDDPTISITEAMENILEEEGLSIEDASVMDYEELYAEIEIPDDVDDEFYGYDELKKENVLAQRLFLMVMTGKRH